MGLGHHIILTQEKLEEHKFPPGFGSGQYGALVSFDGVVRSRNCQKTVVGIEFDIHERLAYRALEKICDEASKQFDAHMRIILLHRFGHIPVGELSVRIHVASAHRDAAFLACRFLIEELKRRVTIWKLEKYIDGTSSWLKGNSLVEEPNL